ncbi:6532_t:CDS:2 [Acaulospora colombiana]|uniref:6532_t:CDS:1 n=1 Tax=Acaulospora colombiana TaxID=27376 RepID=A0ACA9LF50_9GLOM|nr:6532_t:CDS:2 [Acaulospora colombiana]
MDRVDATDQQMLESLIIKAKQSDFVYLQSLGRISYRRFRIIIAEFGAEHELSFQDNEISRAIAQRKRSAALPALYSSEVMDSPEPSPEDLVTAYCQIADLHVSQGNYSTAFKLLAESKDKFIGIRRAALQWVVCLEKILYHKCFERDEFSNIDALETQLRGSCQDDEPMHTDFDYHRALYLEKIDRSDEILIHFDLANRAKAMIENIMPVILAEHSLYMQSIAHFIYAQCMIARITLDIKAQQKQSISWGDVLVPLKIAQKGFTRLESVSQLLNVIQLKSYIYNATGDIAKRDFEAREFRNLYGMQKANRRKQPDWDIPYYARYIQIQKEQLSPSKQDSGGWRGDTPESELEDSSLSTDTDTIRTIPMDTSIASTSAVNTSMASTNVAMTSAITMDTDDVSEDVAFEEYLNFP